MTGRTYLVRKGHVKGEGAYWTINYRTNEGGWSDNQREAARLGERDARIIVANNGGRCHARAVPTKGFDEP